MNKIIFRDLPCTVVINCRPLAFTCIPYFVINNTTKDFCYHISCCSCIYNYCSLISITNKSLFKISNELTLCGELSLESILLDEVETRTSPWCLSYESYYNCSGICTLGWVVSYYNFKDCILSVILIYVIETFGLEYLFHVRKRCV